MDHPHPGALALIAAVGTVVKTVPGLDFVIQMGWVGALAGSMVALSRRRNNPDSDPWLAVILCTLLLVAFALFVQLLSETS